MPLDSLTCTSGSFSTSCAKHTTASNLAKAGLCKATQTKEAAHKTASNVAKAGLCKPPSTKGSGPTAKMAAIPVMNLLISLMASW